MTRRAVAMLLVLVSLVLAVTASLNIARVATTAISAERADAARRACNDLLSQGELAAMRWCADRSSKVVLPPDSPHPVLAVLHDDLGDARIAVTAIDLLGMPPAEALLAGSPLCSDIPGDVRLAVDALRGAPRPLGPDQLDRARLPRPVFPRSFSPTSPGLGDAGTRAPITNRTPSDPSGVHELPACAALVAFTRPTNRARRGPTSDLHPITLNINTAPAPLLARAFALAGLDTLETVLDARTRNEPASLHLQADAAVDLRFITHSTLWAFRIDARSGPVSRSWWSVFELDAGAWRLVQRIPIDV